MKSTFPVEEFLTPTLQHTVIIWYVNILQQLTHVCMFYFLNLFMTWNMKAAISVKGGVYFYSTQP